LLKLVSDRLDEVIAVDAGLARRVIPQLAGVA